MRIKYFFTFITVISLLFINGCVQKDIELKTKTEIQDLVQVSIIGTQIGNIPPNFTVVTTEGKVVRLHDFIENEKPVIVYFMATWCPWCARDYAALSKVYKNYENNVSIISISLDLSEDIIQLNEYKKTYPELQNTIFAQGQSEIMINYKVTKTTTKYAIGRNGRIVDAGFGAFDEEQWKKLLDALTGDIDDAIYGTNLMTIKSGNFSTI